MIESFGSLYAGHVDFDDIGFDAMPLNDRWLSGVPDRDDDDGFFWGLNWIRAGSFENTSTAAPAIKFSFKASFKSFSSTILPRAALII